MIPVCEPVLDGNEERYVLDCLKSNWISSSGRYITEFEERFSSYCGATHGIACSSGTAALHLALKALQIGPGDEVIIPCFTLIVAANTVLMAGATPVLVDVDPDTWCMDPARIEARMTPRTKAIMAVHMYGHPCDMDPILEIAKRRNCFVIEDASEAHGAEYKGRKVGGLGDAGCFSFYGNKIITTGEGGMVVTDREAVAARARLLRNQAFEEPRFVHRDIGFNYRLTNLQAAIGLAQCEKIKEKVERKRALAESYRRLLAGAEELTLPAEAPWARNVYWMYGVLLRDGFGRSRDDVMRMLREQGVETRQFFHPLHRQPALTGLFEDGRYPVSEDLAARGLYIPSGMGLTAAQIEEVAGKLLACRA
jgi:perosamine synthetase